MRAGAVGVDICKTDLGTFELRSTFGGFGTIQTHAEAFFANRYAVIPNGKIVFINRRSATLAIEIDKRFYVSNTKHTVVNLPQSIDILSLDLNGQMTEKKDQYCVQNVILRK